MESLGTGLLDLTGGEQPKMVLLDIASLSWEKIFFISAWFLSRPKLTRLRPWMLTPVLEPESSCERRPFLSDMRPQRHLDLDPPHPNRPSPSSARGLCLSLLSLSLLSRRCCGPPIFVLLPAARSQVRSHGEDRISRFRLVFWGKWKMMENLHFSGVSPSISVRPRFCATTLAIAHPVYKEDEKWHAWKFPLLGWPGTTSDTGEGGSCRLWRGWGGAVVPRGG